MYADISRDSFDRSRDYRRVLMQQGRPLTDADWNEQMALLAEREWRLIRSMLRSDHGTFDGGFFPQIADKSDPTNVTVCPGSYYVKGLRCDYVRPAESTSKAAAPNSINRKLEGKDYFVVLQAWEQSVNPAMDSGILEPALRGIDSAWRSRVAWRVALRTPVSSVMELLKTSKVGEKGGASGTEKPSPETVATLIQKHCRCTYEALGLPNPSDRKLYVRRTQPANSTANTPCELTDTRQGTSLGEAVYRVEVHRGGKPYDSSAPPTDWNSVMTFKWSRENGAAVYAVETPVGKVLKMSSGRFRSKLLIDSGNRLELMDGQGRSVNKDRHLVRVTAQSGQYLLDEAFSIEVPNDPLMIHTSFPETSEIKDLAPYHVRRWCQSGDPLTPEQRKAIKPATTANNGKAKPTIDDDGSVIAISRLSNENVSIPLEGNLEIRFANVTYEEGDYWIVRTSDFTASGIVTDDLPDSKSGELTIPRMGGNESVVFGLLHADEQGQWSWHPGDPQTTLLCWNGKKLEPECPTKCMTTYECESTQKPPAGKVSGAAGEAQQSAKAANPATQECSIRTAPFLSSDGRQALAPLLASRSLITRRVPARYLNHVPESSEYRRFRSALLVSEILGPSAESYLEKVRRCLPDSDAEWTTIEQDARRDYALAVEFERTLSTGDGSKSLIA